MKASTAADESRTSGKVKNTKFQSQGTTWSSKETATGSNISFNAPRQNKKTIFDSSAANASGSKPIVNKNQGNQGDLLPPGQNKKIVFDSESISTTSEPKPKDKNLGNQGGLLPAGQNKKIVFDESYIVNSEDPAAEDKEDAWYQLLIRPDQPWYQQGKKLKADSSTPSPEEVKKCEEEGRRYLEEDTVNYQRGLLFNLNLNIELRH